MASEEHYEYIRAIIDCGSLTWEYKLVGGRAEKMPHDEDVEKWSDEDIRKLTRSMLNVEEDDPVKIEVEYC